MDRGFDLNQMIVIQNDNQRRFDQLQVIQEQIGERIDGRQLCSSERLAYRLKCIRQRNTDGSHKAAQEGAQVAFPFIERQPGKEIRLCLQPITNHYAFTVPCWS